MRTCTSLIVVATAIGLMASVPTLAIAQSKDAIGSDRYGSDRYGSDRYGSDRYGSDRYGSDRYGSDRYGSDRYGSDRYGSDRYGSDRYGSDRYGSDRAAAAPPPDQQRFGSDRYGSDRYGSDRYGSDRYGSDRAAAAAPDPQRYGSDRYGSDRYGSDRYGSDRAAAPPDQQRPGSDRNVSDLPNRIRVEYAPPQNPDQQKVYDLVKEHRVLETLQQILSPFRLPAAGVTIKTLGCNGMINSWYNTDDSVPTVHMCYELLQDVLQNVPKETTPEGITPRDAVVGQFLFWTLHEFGHAVFDIYQVPLFASEEDSADRFAVFVMLQFGKDQARRLIGGAAYAANEIIKNYNLKSNVEKPLEKYSSVHGLPEQRFFNLLCLAYGADPKLFADVVEKEFLPKRRAGNCEYEYQSFARAFRSEIGGPHIDRQMARVVLDTTWLPPQSNSQPLTR